MIKLKRIGFYSELKYGDKNETSIKEVISNQESRYEEEIINYLSNGVLLVASTGISKDVISKVMIGSPDILTDGEWCWCKDLVYYVKKYHLKLPNEFVDSIAEKGFTIPTISKTELEMLEL